MEHGALAQQRRGELDILRGLRERDRLPSQAFLEAAPRLSPLSGDPAMTRLLPLLALALTAGCASAAYPQTDIQQETQECLHMGGHVHTDGRGGIVCTFPGTY